MRAIMFLKMLSNMEKSLKLLKVSGRTRRSLEDINNKLHNLLNVLAKIVISMNMEMLELLMIE